MAGNPKDLAIEQKWLVGVDIGGTFTDVILIGPDGEVVTDKVLSSAPDFATSVLAAIGQVIGDAGISPDQIVRVLHGTTVATNAILEMTGARTSLVTTAGFRDVLELGRLRRPRLYDLNWSKPLPLAARRHRYELHQRISATGELLSEVSSEEVKILASQMNIEGIEAVAVCLINSYVRPDVERKVADQLRDLLPGVFVTASVDVSPSLQEFERTSTAVVNAYVGPVVERYISDLSERLRSSGISASFLIMQSSGGLLPASAVAISPVQIIESGPAAGVTAVQKLTQTMGLQNVVAFDMGGTTAKASLIEGGVPFVAIDYEVGGGMSATRGLHKGDGYLVRFPSIDIAEVGAGGGSIITRDLAGSLHVGPESASARPGPACYGQGGDRPTLTDANVVLGYLNPVSLAGGNVKVAPDLAIKVLKSLADEFGLDAGAVARGAYDVAVSNMTKVVKSVTSERGRDPRESTLVAFGGAGPLYGAYLAKELGIKTILVPAFPGLFSSLGLLVADIERQVVTPYRPEHNDPIALEKTFSELAAGIAKDLSEHGSDSDAIVIERILDARYRGQRFELRISLTNGALNQNSIAKARHDFHDEHQRTYGRSGPDELVEFVNLRLRGKIINPITVESILAGRKAAAPTTTTRMCRFDKVVETQVLNRAAIGTSVLHGPLVIEDMDATTLVPPGATARLDAYSNIVITWIDGESA
jgi:N-methylhydantoinase A